MSMDNSTSSTSLSRSDRIWLTLWLSRHLRQRREAMGLPVNEAAYIAGMPAELWYALEGGWVPPDDHPVLDAAAHALEVNVEQLSFLAAVAQYQRAALP